MSLDHPGLVMRRLEEIEADLALKQNELEDAAMAMARAKRDHEREYAMAFVATEGTQEERKAKARLALKQDAHYAEALGRWEGIKAVVRTLETRASIGQSVLRAQTREFSTNTAVQPRG